MSDIALKVSLHGFDGKSYKAMFMFLQGPCRGKATIVDVEESDAEIIDIDQMNSKTILEGRIAKKSGKAIIVMSLDQVKMDGVFFIKKPIQAVAMMNVFADVIKSNKDRRNKDKRQTKVDGIESIKAKNNAGKAGLSMDNEFTSGFTIETGVKKSNNELAAYTYDFRNCAQGYVQSGVKLATSKQVALKLKFGWKTIIIDPTLQRIWIDADDNQTIKYIAIESTSGVITKANAAPFDIKSNEHMLRSEMYQTIEEFLWKISLWTSKGRFPSGVDLNRNVFLTRWPNLTRMAYIPHSLRISALLTEKPMTLLAVAKTLDIPNEYVFAFFSAACALGIAGQHTAVNEEKVNSEVSKPKEVTTEKKGLFGRIMNKLRGN